MMPTKRYNAILLLIGVLVVQWVQNALIINWNHEDALSLQEDAILGPNKPSTPRRPVFIYHPGPPKMGTTSLQCALSANQLLLAEDGYIFAGKIPHKFCPSTLKISSTMNVSQPALGCLTNLTCQHAVQKAFRNNWKHAPWETLTRELHRISSDHQQQQQQQPTSLKGLILSDETHSMFHESPLSEMPRLLTQTLFSNNWTKHLVVGYRWYWQYWLSARHEYNRLFTGAGTRRQMQSWNGRHLQSMVTMLREEIGARNCYLNPHTQSVLSLYGPYFDKITILNLHDNDKHGDFVQHFMCEILDKAPRTCQSYKLEQARYNPATHIFAADVDRLVMAAADRGWINTTHYRRWFVVNATMHEQQQNLVPKLTMECPSQQDLNALLQKSLQEETRIFGPKEQAMSDRPHVQQFWQTNFCAIHVQQTLRQDANWKSFFQQRFGGQEFASE